MQELPFSSPRATKMTDKRIKMDKETGKKMTIGKRDAPELWKLESRW